MRNNSKSVAVVIVDTSQHTLANNALLQSMRGFDFQQVLIFSDSQRHWGELPIIQISQIRDLSQYNHLIALELTEHITTEYCLIIQYDGFIINPDQFSSHFFHYDYIGAPWPHFDNMNVGNGGFSWRSRRLIESVARQPYEDLSVAEDLHICRQLRPELEKLHGISFAPPSIAAHFSTESVPVAFPTFGFHGVFHLPQIYRESIDYLAENLSVDTARRWKHLLLPAVEEISNSAALRISERILQHEQQRQI